MWVGQIFLLSIATKRLLRQDAVISSLFAQKIVIKMWVVQNFISNFLQIGYNISIRHLSLLSGNLEMVCGGVTP